MNNNNNNTASTLETTNSEKAQPVVNNEGNNQNEMSNAKMDGKSRATQHLIGIGILVSTWVYQFAAFLLILIFSVIKGYELTDDGLQTAEERTLIFTSLLIVLIIYTIILIIIYRGKILTGIKNAVPNVGRGILKVIGYSILSLVFTIAFRLLDSVLFPELANVVGENQDAIVDSFTGSLSIAMILSMTIFAPIVEEYIFRYGIMEKLLYKFPKVIKIILSSVIFSFVHIGFSQLTGVDMFVHLMLGYMGTSLAFSWVYAREGNLFYPILIHIVNNTLGVLGALILIAAGLY